LIKIIVFKYPNYHYGDQAILEGKIKKGQSPFYHGLMFYPKINLLSSGNGWLIKEWLLNFKNQFQENLKKVLPYDRAVFLSGLTVGGRSEFSLVMQEKFRLSGTSHLVALSGMNITIIIAYIGIFLDLILSRRGRFLAIIGFIFLFVLMTGGEASIIRATIMASIVILAKGSGRFFSVRNALAAVALVMVLYDPRVLVWDLGFQLSFAAIIGIIYFKSWLEKKLGIKKSLWWDAVLTTIAAELAVFPLLFFYFLKFFLWGLIANPLIELFIPMTMLLGFTAGLLGFVSYHLSLLVAGLVNIILAYELAVINLFAISF
jgi:competence protein ComEC